MFCQFRLNITLFRKWTLVLPLAAPSEREPECRAIKIQLISLSTLDVPSPR
jgi:hypothetical protein